MTAITLLIVQDGKPSDTPPAAANNSASKVAAAGGDSGWQTF